MLVENSTKLKKNHEIVLNTFSRSLIIWRARHWSMAPGNERGPGNELEGPESWTVPRLENYTL